MTLVLVEFPDCRARTSDEVDPNENIGCIACAVSLSTRAWPHLHKLLRLVCAWISWFDRPVREAGEHGLEGVKYLRKSYCRPHSGSYRHQTVVSGIAHALASIATTFIVPTFLNVPAPKRPGGSTSTAWREYSTLLPITVVSKDVTLCIQSSGMKHENVPRVSDS